MAAPSDRECWIDTPCPGQRIGSGPIPIVGWALFADSAVRRVEVLLDGRPAGRLTIGCPRSDVAAGRAAVNAAVCGFEGTAQLPIGVGHGTHLELTAVATSLDGTQAACSMEVVVDTGGGELDGLPPTWTAAAPRASDAVRMLVFAHSLEIGGAQHYLRELVIALAAEPAFEITVAAPTPGLLSVGLQAHGIPVLYHGGIPATTIEHCEWVSKMSEWALAQRFNVVLLNSLATHAGAQVARQADLPYVWVVHESHDPEFFWQMLHSFALDRSIVREAAYALGQSAALVFDAEATRRKFSRYAAHERTHVVPLCVSMQRLDKAASQVDLTRLRTEAGIPENATVVVSVGTIEPRKCQTVLAQALASLAAVHPNAHLVLVGSRGDLPVMALQDFLLRSGFQSRVTIVDVTQHHVAWLMMADLYVCASDMESLPMSIMEAMALGIPVLSTEVFGVPELITDGVTGYLCGAGDLGDLTAALHRVLSISPDERSRVGAAGQAVVRAERDASLYISWYRNYLLNLLSVPR